MFQNSARALPLEMSILGASPELKTIRYQGCYARNVQQLLPWVSGCIHCRDKQVKRWRCLTWLLQRRISLHRCLEQTLGWNRAVCVFWQSEWNLICFIRVPSTEAVPRNGPCQVLCPNLPLSPLTRRWLPVPNEFNALRLLRDLTPPSTSEISWFDVWTGN